MVPTSCDLMVHSYCRSCLTKVLVLWLVHPNVAAQGTKVLVRNRNTLLPRALAPACTCTAPYLHHTRIRIRNYQQLNQSPSCMLSVPRLQHVNGCMHAERKEVDLRQDSRSRKGQPCPYSFVSVLLGDGQTIICCCDLSIYRGSAFSDQLSWRWFLLEWDYIDR